MPYAHSLNIFQEWSSDINQEIEKNFSILKSEGLLHEHPFIKKIYEWTMHYLKNNGKRMHGLSIILSYKACGGHLYSNIVKVAAAFQLYHHFTIVHDDIYDEDIMRRGWPTTHEFFSKWFSSPSNCSNLNENSKLFINDMSRRGTITAFAYGKIIRALAFNLIHQSGFLKEKIADALDLLNQHDVYDNIAQLNDIYYENGKSNNAEECLSNAWLKTGRFFQVGAEVGGLFADATSSQIDALKIWAGNSGLAYQLQDDLEDLEQESEKGQGRGIGQDILYRKPTYLYALAKTITSGENKKDLFNWENNSANENITVAHIIKILNASGAILKCKNKINQLRIDSHQILKSTVPQFSQFYISVMKDFSEYFVSKDYWRRKLANISLTELNLTPTKSNFYHYFIFDIHGVLLGKTYPGMTITPTQVLSNLSKKDKKVFFLTNSSSMSPDMIASELKKNNISVNKDQIITAGMIVGNYISQHFDRPKIYLIGSPLLKETISEYCKNSIQWSEGDEADLVVVSRDSMLDDKKILSAKAAAQNGAILLATCRDKTFPGKNGVEAGPGQTVEKIESIMQQQAFVVGKPNSYVLRHIIGLTEAQLNQTLVIGDSLEQDIQLGINSHCDTAWINDQKDSSDENRNRSTYQFTNLENLCFLAHQEKICV